MLPFDRVSVPNKDGNVDELTPEEFRRLPVFVRVRAVLSDLQFFKGTQRVERSAALRALRELEVEALNPSTDA